MFFKEINKKQYTIKKGFEKALWLLCSTLNSWIGEFVFWCHEQVIWCSLYDNTVSILKSTVLSHLLRLYFWLMSQMFSLWYYTFLFYKIKSNKLSHQLCNWNLHFLFISNLINKLRLHQFLGTKTIDASKSLKTDANGAY